MWISGPHIDTHGRKPLQTRVYIEHHTTHTEEEVFIKFSEK